MLLRFARLARHLARQLGVVLWPGRDQDDRGHHTGQVRALRAIGLSTAAVFGVSIRVPAWSKKTVLRVDGDSIATPAPVHKSQRLEIIGCLLSLVPPLPHDSMVHVGARL